MNSPLTQQERPPLRISAAAFVKLLKFGPLTVELCMHLGFTKNQVYHAVYELRAAGWPVMMEMRPYSDGYGGLRYRGEYRLGLNWEQKELFK